MKKIKQITKNENNGRKTNLPEEVFVADFVSISNFVFAGGHRYLYTRALPPKER